MFSDAAKELTKGFSALENAGIDAVMISGNHDFDLLPDFLTVNHFSNVTLLGADGNWEILTKKKNENSLSIVGWSFSETSYPFDPLTGIEIILAEIKRPCIGMLHCDTKHPYSIFGYMEVSRLVQMSPYAWILGHLHEPEILNENPPIFYTGSPLSPHSSSGHPCGPVLMEVDGEGLRTLDWVGLG